jgi:hypothetical protein
MVFAVTQELALERPAFGFERHALRQFALRNRSDHARHLAGRMNQIGYQRINRVDGLTPEAACVGNAARRAMHGEVSLGLQ